MNARVQTFANISDSKRGLTASKTKKPAFSPSTPSPVEQILYLQRTIGNRAVQRLIKSEALQTKLTKGQPNGMHEQEADRIADQVTLVPEPKAHLNQTKEVNLNPESGVHALKGIGQYVPKSLHNYFEPRFGYDFTGVKVHTGSEAAETTKFISAKAFTFENDIVFNDGQYCPNSSNGKNLLAHELTHLIQQKESNRLSSMPLIQRKLTQQIQRQSGYPQEYPIVPVFSFQHKTIQGGKVKKFGVCRYSVKYRNLKIIKDPKYRVWRVNADIDTECKWNTRKNIGPQKQKNIPHAYAPVLTPKNFWRASKDLCPDMSKQCGRPRRKEFWAQDLTERHEKFHAKEGEKYFLEAVKKVAGWLAKQKEDDPRNVNYKVVWGLIGLNGLRARLSRGAECRAYSDGAPLYRERSNDIFGLGISGKYPVSQSYFPSSSRDKK
jgi:hypothetical protein